MKIGGIITLFYYYCSLSRCFSGRQGDVLYTLLCYFNKSLKVNETDSATAVLIFLVLA